MVSANVNGACRGRAYPVLLNTKHKWSMNYLQWFVQQSYCKSQGHSSCHMKPTVQEGDFLSQFLCVM
jgi:hypothetical protein